MVPFHPRAMNGHLPPTPPHSGPYDYHAGPTPQFHDGFMPAQHMSQRMDATMDYGHRYAQMQQPDRRSWGNMQSLPPINSYYDTSRAPVLPPLRMQDGAMSGRDYYNYAAPVEQAAQPQQQPAPKEEATGGVSAKLDYDMDMMATFVSNAAQGMYANHYLDICRADADIRRSIQPSHSVSPAFRKWVFQVLSATRLPSATILLSLHYLTVRLRDFPSSIERTENQIYRLLTVSLILGSKFLDDNTFINKSWSDVTGIKVAEINALEITWLALIGFELHASPTDPKGVSLWIQTWQDHVVEEAAKARAAKLSPLSANTPSHRKSSEWNRNSFHSGIHKTAHGSFTPISAGSGSNSGTPYLSAGPWNQPQPTHPHHEYYAAVERYNAEWEQRWNNEHHNRSSHYSQHSLPPLHALAPAYTPWNQRTWEHHHGYGCHCSACTRQAPPYMMGNHFHPQTVVG